MPVTRTCHAFVTACVLSAALATIGCSPLSHLVGLPCATQLTFGPGDDTEAAWSPDGSRIVFQSDRAGTLDLYVLDVATGETTPLVQGPGHACFPTWSPDGKWVVYAYAHFTKTGFEGNEHGYNLFVVSADGKGTPRRLTSGLFRDYCPTVSPDGKTVYFSSTRGFDKRGDVVNLYAVPFAGGEPSPVLVTTGRGPARVQPTLSPDGRVMAFAMVAGFRGNWCIRLARTDQPTDACSLSDSSTAFYGPRWSPIGHTLACTGYQVGDRGWGIYLLDATSGKRRRIATGRANARSPAWAPDATQLVFESNRTGHYKLYRTPARRFAPTLVAPVPPRAPAKRATEGAVLHYTFAQRPTTTVPDHSPLANHGQVHGNVAWKDGAVSCAAKGAHIAVPKAKGFDFGAKAFSVRATVTVPKLPKGLAHIAMGQYPGNTLGWQLYVSHGGHVFFNSRTTDLMYRGARSDTALPVGRPVTLLGVRDDFGRVRLYVDGALQQGTSHDAFFSYPTPIQVRVGTQFDGSASFPGSIHEVAVFRRALSPTESVAHALARFWAPLRRTQ